MTQKARLVILISGSGSNLQSFIDACHHGSINAEIACVISNQSNAYGLKRAQQANIPTKMLSHRSFSSREAFDLQLQQEIEQYQPDLIILAGFMRILTSSFIHAFERKILNIHPSLLPKYPGLNTHQRAIDNQDKFAGATVHLVTPDLDAGPSIIQARVEIVKGDSAEKLAQRILPLEHKIFPLAVKWILEGKVELMSDPIKIDKNPIPKWGVMFNDLK